MGSLSVDSIMGCYLHIALLWLGVGLCDGSYVTVMFKICYVLMNVYAWINEGCMSVHLGDLKVVLLYGWWNGTLFIHCTKYYLRVYLGKGVKVKNGKVMYKRYQMS